MSDTHHGDRMPLRVVIAPDSFKGSLPAAQVAAAIAAGWASTRPGDVLRTIPQADGGEGTIAAIASARPDAVLRDAGTVTGPDGRPTPGRWLQLRDGTAVVELADASGLPLMAELDPLDAQTTGFGQVIGVALDAGATRLVIGLGGSASTDGGAGALVALGLRLYDAHDAPLRPGGGSLYGLARIDASALRPAPPAGVVLLTDVDAPLLGPDGAAAVFAPQKGATVHEALELERALARFAALLGGDPGLPGSGAAGGTGYGLGTAWGATIAPGADYVAELTGLPRALTGADVLITGEGRFDQTSLGGKVVGQLLRRAAAAHVEVGIIAGQVSSTPRTSAGSTIPRWSLTEVSGSVKQAMADPVAALIESGRRAASYWDGRRPQRFVLGAR